MSYSLSTCSIAYFLPKYVMMQGTIQSKRDTQMPYLPTFLSSAVPSAMQSTDNNATKN